MSQFGHISQGASDHTLAADDMLANQKTAGFDGVIYKVAAYLSNFAVDEEVRVGIFSDSGADAPSSRLGQTDIIIGTGVDGWVIAELQEPVVVANGTAYWIVVHAGDGLDVAYDTDGSQNYRTTTYSFGNAIFPTWSGGSNATRKYSVYADTELVGNRKWTGYKGNLWFSILGGGVSWGCATDEMSHTKVVAAEDLTLVRMGMFVKYGLIAGSRFEAGEFGRMAIYSDSGAYPDALLAQTGTFEGSETDDAYYYANLQSPLAITAGVTYWLAWFADSDTIPLYQQWHDGGRYYTGYVADTFSDGPEDPANSPEGGFDDEYNVSIFAEAEQESAGGEQQGVFIDML